MKIKLLYIFFIFMIIVTDYTFAKKPTEFKIASKYKYDSFISCVAVENKNGNLFAVATEKAIFFYDKKGKISKEILLSKFRQKDEKAYAALSNNAQYFAIERSRGLYETIWGMFEYRDKNGNLLFKRNRDDYGDEIFKIMPDGKEIVFVNQNNGRIYIVDKNGRLLLDRKPEINEYVGGIQIEFSKNEKFCLIGVSLGASGDSSFINLIDLKNHSSVFERTIPGLHLENIAVSDNGRYVFGGVVWEQRPGFKPEIKGEYAYLYALNKMLWEKKDSGGFVSITPDGRSIILSSMTNSNIIPQAVIVSIYNDNGSPVYQLRLSDLNLPIANQYSVHSFYSYHKSNDTYHVISFDRFNVDDYLVSFKNRGNDLAIFNMPAKEPENELGYQMTGLNTNRLKIAGNSIYLIGKSIIIRLKR
jgi:hypothetical protein